MERCSEQKASAGNYNVFVKCQDFGIMESARIASSNYVRKRKPPHTSAHI